MKSFQLLFTLALSQCTLHEAARQANLECIQELDSFDELNEHGSNALHSALQGNNENGQIENIVKILLEKGVSVEVVNKNGFLPAHALYRNDKITEDDKLSILALMRPYGPVPDALPWINAFGYVGVMPPPKMSKRLQAAATFYSLFPVEIKEDPVAEEEEVKCNTEESDKLLETHLFTIQKQNDQIEKLKEDILQAKALAESLQADNDKVIIAAQTTKEELETQSNQIDTLKHQIVELSKPKPEVVCDVCPDLSSMHSQIESLESDLKERSSILAEKLAIIEKLNNDISILNSVEPVQCPEPNIDTNIDKSVNCTEDCAQEIDQLEREKKYIAVTAFQMLIVTGFSIIMFELWTKFKHGQEWLKGDDEAEQDRVNIVQLRIRHEIEKQSLITQLDQQKKRNANLTDSNVGYISDLESKSEKLNMAAAESAENHARLVDAMSELKAKENTIHELHKIVKAVKQTHGDESSESDPKLPTETDKIDDELTQL